MTTPLGRPRTFPPRKHRHRNEERVWWGDRWYSLGPAGSDKAKAEYLRLVALWQDDPYAVPDRVDDYLVPELFRDYLATEPPQAAQVRRCGEILAELHLRTPIETFGPRDLAAWQRWLCDKRVTVGSRTGERLYAAEYVMKLVGIVRRVFKWAVETERVPGDRHAAMKAVRGPRPGQVRAGKAVGPVSEAAFAATLPYLPASLRAFARVQRLTGARPSEILRLRPVDLDMSQEGWSYSPAVHKTSRRGHVRVLIFGPKAQAVLREVWPADDAGYFFPVKAQPRGPRKAARWPSHVARYEREKARRPRRPIGQPYTASSYRQAVRRACLWAKVEPWTPYQLRHAFAREVDARFGLDHVQASLGHTSAEVSRRYARRNESAARRVAAEIG